MRKIVRFQGIDCANCAAKLEKSLSKIKGVNEVQINFMAQKVLFELDDNNLEEVIEQIKKTTKKIHPECEYKGL